MNELISLVIVYACNSKLTVRLVAVGALERLKKVSKMSDAFNYKLNDQMALITSKI